MITEGFPPYEEPPQSPLFHAKNAGRYARQQLIREYENHINCRLIVMIDVIYYDSVTFLEELLYDCSPNEDLHLMINSPGGVGEVAVRLARSAQSRCRELTIIVPDQAKSAATLLAVGGHQIIMAPAGDLGPVDPQFFHGRGWVAAKDIIAAVEDALQEGGTITRNLPGPCLAVGGCDGGHGPTGQICFGQHRRYAPRSIA